jgi:protocatechuate 3,4-dioxygenase beta subunit
MYERPVHNKNVRKKGGRFMGNDIKRIYRIFNRRDALKVLGMAGVAMAGGFVTGLSRAGNAGTGSGQVNNGVSSCITRPEVTEGPYYLPVDLNRPDIRSDPATGAVKDGALLTLIFRVSHSVKGACTPLQGAKVEIWHCDARGVYSGVSDPWFNTVGQNFLRGYQITDAKGEAGFLTIYPGWYAGRAVHIHFKVRQDASPGSSVFTSQLFFDDSLSDRVHLKEPYVSRGRRNTLNSTDMIYRKELLLSVDQSGDGYKTFFDIEI